MMKFVAKITILIFVFSVFVGCSSKSINNASSEAVCLSVVITNNDTFPAITSTTVTSIYDEVLNACEAGVSFDGGSVSLVVADGKGYTCFDERIKTITANITESKRRSEAEGVAAQIIRKAAIAEPKVSEIDMLQALNIASRAVRRSSAPRKKILVYANGLQTTGMLNMTSSDLINSDFKSLCKELVSKNAVYDYSEIEFVWIGLGCVSADSKQIIPNSIIPKLEGLWTNIIESAGGVVTFKPDYITGESVDNVHNVSIVNFPEDKIENITINTLNRGIKLDGETLKFKGDLAEFVNFQEAKKTLLPIVNQISELKTKIIIVGTTASAGSESECYKLSLDRAETCKKLLVSMGVKNDDITTLGIGRKKCFLRVKDTDNNGFLIEPEAQKNRAIFIYNMDSEVANKIISLCNQRLR